MDIKKHIFPFAMLSAAMVCLALAIFLAGHEPETAHGAISSDYVPNISQATTTATVSVTTSTRVLATTTSTTGTSYDRAFTEICNAGGKSVVLRLDQDKPANASTAGGIWLTANDCFVLDFPYQGSITASSSDQSATPLLVNDYVY